MTNAATPSSRTLVGIGAILLLIASWAALIAFFAPFVGRWPTLVQALFYLVTGIVWIVPVRPLFRWIGRGSGRAR